MSLLGDIGSAASGVLGFLGGGDANRTNRQIARETNAANVDIANAQMAFQERMSNTAYQRAMADMKKAGLNPIYAANMGGASSPPGSAIQAVTGAPQQNVITGAVSSAIDAYRASMEYKQLNQTLENMKSSNDQTKSQTALNQALKVTAQKDAQLKATNSRYVAQNAKNLGAEYPSIKAEGDIDRTLYGRALRYLGRLNPFGQTSSSLIHSGASLAKLLIK